MGLSVFGENPAGLKAFKDDGPSGDEYRLAENVGKSLIITVIGPKEITTKRYGVKTAVMCDLVELQDDGTGKPFKNIAIFNAAPVDQLKPLAGQTIVATIGTYEKKSGGQAPRFEEPTPEVVAAAEKCMKATA